MVQRNGHVRLLGHYYSVPHTYVGKKDSMRKRKTKERGKSLAMKIYYIYFCKINNSNNQQKKIRLKNKKDER